MKRLIFLIFTIICGIILYTCASPLTVDVLPTTATSTFYSRKPVIAGSTDNIYLGVNVQSTQISIGFVTSTETPSDETVRIDDVETGNAISGTYPNISFQNGLISGTIRFISDEQIKISFQQRIYPYLKMWDVVCETRTP